MSFGVTAAVVGGGIAAYGAMSAADTQADAANNATDAQLQQYNQTRSDLEPYRNLGTDNIAGLQALANNPFFTQGFYYGDFKAPTAAEAQQTPGYEFTLNQGLKAAQNSASARGLGSSGAALKGAESYATGLADSTYNDTFNRALATYNSNRDNALGSYTTNQQVLGNQYNRLLGLVNLGQNSATATASAGQQATNAISNNITSGAAASAAGTVGAANAINSGISNGLSYNQNNQLLSSLRNNSTLYGNATDAYGNPV